MADELQKTSGRQGRADSERAESEVRSEGRRKTLCSVTSCKAEATTGIAINIPAKGVPIAEHSPLRLVLGAALCQRCYELEEASVEDWLDMRHETTKATVRDVVAGICLQRRLADPDFARAFVTPVALDSDEFIAVNGGPPAENEFARMPWTGMKKGR